MVMLSRPTSARVPSWAAPGLDADLAARADSQLSPWLLWQVFLAHEDVIVHRKAPGTAADR